jgi:hypothetical protein
MKLDEILRLAQHVGRHTAFPITSADQLVQALGGDHATQRIGRKDRNAAEVRQIPSAYFPIESEADFFTKITHLFVLSGEPVEDQFTRVKALGKPPAAAGEPPTIPSQPTHGVPGARGWK